MYGSQEGGRANQLVTISVLNQDSKHAMEIFSRVYANELSQVGDE